MHKRFVVPTIIVIAVFWVWVGFNANAIAIDIQTSDENSVRVDVKPVALIAGKPAVFEIRLNTHSVNLNYDMLEVSTLQDSEGKIYKAVEWKGSPLGGHHRRGILEFPKLGGIPQSVKLILRRIAGVSERSFEWKIGS
jgi:YHS domain-containing protein